MFWFWGGDTSIYSLCPPHAHRGRSVGDSARSSLTVCQEHWHAYAHAPERISASRSSELRKRASSRANAGTYVEMSGFAEIASLFLHGNLYTSSNQSHRRDTREAFLFVYRLHSPLLYTPE